MSTGAASLPSALAGSKGRRRRERLVGRVFLAAGLTSVVISAFIILTLIGEAV
jgi:hypothetical protein